MQLNREINVFIIDPRFSSELLQLYKTSVQLYNIFILSRKFDLYGKNSTFRAAE